VTGFEESSDVRTGLFVTAGLACSGDDVAAAGWVWRNSEATFVERCPLIMGDVVIETDVPSAVILVKKDSLERESFRQVWHE
jgi:hypothetical protein